MGSPLAPVLKALKIIFYYPFLFVFNLVVFLILFPFSVLYGTIFSAIFFSANFRMRRKHMRPVKLYLDHFERLHPDLMSRIAQDAARNRDGWLHRDLDLWPHTGKGWLMPAPSNAESCPSAIFFAGLEHAGWAREVIYALLQDQVEGAGCVTGEEKAQFARSMGVMCDHQIKKQAIKMITWSLRKAPTADEELGVLPATELKEGEEGIEAQVDSLDWILQRGKVVTPTRSPKDYQTCLVLMLKLIDEFEEVWDMKDNRILKTLSPNYWQLLQFPPEIFD